MNNTSFNFSISRNIKDNRLQGVSMSISTLFQHIKEYAETHKSNVKTDSHYIVPCDFGNNQVRKNANAVARTMLCVDLDLDPSFDKIDSFIKRHNLIASVWTTFSHMIEKKGVTCERYRMTIFLKTPVKSEEFVDAKAKLIHYFTQELDCVVDESSFVLTQAAALPITNTDSGYDCQYWNYDNTELFDFDAVITPIQLKQVKQCSNKQDKGIGSIDFKPMNTTALLERTNQEALITFLKDKKELHSIKTHYAGAVDGICRQMVVANLIFLGIDTDLIIDLDSIMCSNKPDSATFAEVWKGATAYETTYAGVIMKLLSQEEKIALGLTKASAFTVDTLVQSKTTELTVAAGDYLSSIKAHLNFKQYKVSQLFAAAGLGKSQLVLDAAMNKDNHIIFTVPTRALAEQLSKQMAANMGMRQGFWTELCFYADTQRGFNVNKHNIIICTHASFHKLAQRIDQQSLLSKWSVFVDEAHSLVTTASRDYRYSAMGQISDHIEARKFNNFVLLTATPVLNLRLENTIDHTFIIKSTQRNTVDFKFLVTGDIKVNETVAIKVKEAVDKGNVVAVFYNNTEESGGLGMLKSLLIAQGIAEAKIATINAKNKGSDEYEMITEGSVSTSDVILTTSLLVEGVSIEDTRNATVITVGHWGSVQNIQIANRFRKSKQVTFIKCIKKLGKNTWGLCSIEQAIADNTNALECTNSIIIERQKLHPLTFEEIELLNIFKSNKSAGSAYRVSVDKNSFNFIVERCDVLLSNVIYNKNIDAELSNHTLEISQMQYLLALTGQQGWSFGVNTAATELDEAVVEVAKAHKKMVVEQNAKTRQAIIETIAQETSEVFDEMFSNGIKNNSMGNQESEVRFILSKIMSHYDTNKTAAVPMIPFIDYMLKYDIKSKRDWTAHESVLKIQATMKDSTKQLHTELKDIQTALLDFTDFKANINDAIAQVFVEVGLETVVMSQTVKFGTDEKSTLVKIAESLVNIERKKVKLEDGSICRMFKVTGVREEIKLA